MGARQHATGRRHTLVHDRRRAGYSFLERDYGQLADDGLPGQGAPDDARTMLSRVLATGDLGYADHPSWSECANRCSPSTSPRIGRCRRPRAPEF